MEREVDGSGIIDVGFDLKGDTSFCYALMIQPPYTVYRLHGGLYRIINSFNSSTADNGGRSATELYKSSGLSWPTASKSMSKLISLKILKYKTKKGVRIYYINDKLFHFHSQHAIILFNTFWKP